MGEKRYYVFFIPTSVRNAFAFLRIRKTKIAGVHKMAIHSEPLRAIRKKIELIHLRVCLRERRGYIQNLFVNQDCNQEIFYVCGYSHRRKAVQG